MSTTSGKHAHERSGSTPRVRAGRAKHIACTHDDLVEVAIAAIQCGSTWAQADGDAALRDSAAILRAALAACEEALRHYVPLDERAFRAAFTLTWSAGYWGRFVPAPNGRSPARSSEPIGELPLSE